jgi:hypothetical protein
MTVTLEPLFGEADGYDGEGYDSEGYARDGYNADGYDRSGYDRDGYDADGNNRSGYDRDGDPQNVDPGDLNLGELWSSFGSYSESAFLRYLRGITREPGAIDAVVFCVSCGEPKWEEDTFCARGDFSAHLCDECVSDWTSCYCCGSMFPDVEMDSLLSGESVCARCCENRCAFCEECDGYYLESDSDDHDHDSGGCDCESAQQEFTVRNDGCDPLANDTRVTVTLPSGIISDQGLKMIRDYLRTELDALRNGYDYDQTYAMTMATESLGNEWQTNGGNYPKRLSRLLYRGYKVKLPPAVLSQVGCIARDNSGSQDSYALEVTRNLNMSADDFYHDGSCWWGSYSESRCALKTNGGYALRTFSQWDGVSGRAWVMPLRACEDKPAWARLQPTFDTEAPDALMVFNGYGELSGYTAARIVAHMAGWTYRKVRFTCEPMYVNSLAGYLIAPEDTVKDTDLSLNLSVDQHASLFAREQYEREQAAEAAAEAGS